MTEMALTDNWSCKTRKLQSNHQHQQTNIKLFTGRMPFLSPNQQRQSTEGKQDNQCSKTLSQYVKSVIK